MSRPRRDVTIQPRSLPPRPSRTAAQLRARPRQLTAPTATCAGAARTRAEAVHPVPASRKGHDGVHQQRLACRGRRTPAMRRQVRNPSATTRVPSRSGARSRTASSVDGASGGWNEHRCDRQRSRCGTSSESHPFVDHARGTLPSRTIELLHEVSDSRARGRVYGMGADVQGAVLRTLPPDMRSTK